MPKTTDAQNSPKPTETLKPSTNQSAPSNSSSTCHHYEAGRCWDNLEDEAYNQGQDDKYYGRYGASYYEIDDCDNLCKDILEDAYNEGYEDY